MNPVWGFVLINDSGPRMKIAPGWSPFRTGPRFSAHLRLAGDLLKARVSIHPSLGIDKWDTRISLNSVTPELGPHAAGHELFAKRNRDEAPGMVVEAFLLTCQLT
jgi:hypothetical protein